RAIKEKSGCSSIIKKPAGSVEIQPVFLRLFRKLVFQLFSFLLGFVFTLYFVFIFVLVIMVFAFFRRLVFCIFEFIIQRHFPHPFSIFYLPLLFPLNTQKNIIAIKKCN